MQKSYGKKQKRGWLTTLEGDSRLRCFRIQLSKELIIHYSSIQRDEFHS